MNEDFAGVNDEMSNAAIGKAGPSDRSLFAFGGLGELAHEKRALEARDVTMVAISPDASEDAREMADRYGIEFSLLADEDLAIAKQFAGLSSDGYPLPSVYLLRPDGSTYLRRIEDFKDERLYAAELLAHLDAMAGRSGEGLPAVSGFARRLVASLGLSVQRIDGEHDFSSAISVLAMRTMGEYLSVGAEIGALVLPERELGASAVLGVQWPLWAEIGEVYARIPLGARKAFSDGGTNELGLLYGLRLGLGFEINPNLLMQLEVAFDATELGDEMSGTTARLPSIKDDSK
ncbi:MAG: peroxiredoxin family protein [Myxococcales bacterium]|nr:peroxiredoxin family protein [Myxococcales bacterium]